MAIPRMVVALQDLVPRRKAVARDVGSAGFDAAAMLGGVGAHDFNLECRDVCGSGYLTPRLTRQVPGIHTIGEDGRSDTQIVGGDRAGNRVPRAVNRETSVAKGLLDRIDPQMHAAGMTRHLARNRGFPCSRQAAQYDQHGSIHIYSYAPVICLTSPKKARLRAELIPQFTGTLW